MEKLVPKDYGEEIAVFRSQLIGPLVHRVLTRGQLHSALAEIASQAVRPPGRVRTRHFSVPTLERWYYRFKKSGVAGLTPVPRSDRGRAKALTEPQRQLICEVRREHPSASAGLILRTLIDQGRVGEKAVSPTTVRRMLATQGQRPRLAPARAGPAAPAALGGLPRGRPLARRRLPRASALGRHARAAAPHSWPSRRPESLCRRSGSSVERARGGYAQHLHRGGADSRSARCFVPR